MKSDPAQCNTLSPNKQYIKVELNIGIGNVIMRENKKLK